MCVYQRLLGVCASVLLGVCSSVLLGACTSMLLGVCASVLLGVCATQLLGVCTSLLHVVEQGTLQEIVSVVTVRETSAGYPFKVGAAAGTPIYSKPHRCNARHNDK